MSQSVILPVAGLVTDPGPFTAAPEGSLVVADNVVVLRPGVIEPRPGTSQYVDAVLKAGPYGAQHLYIDENKRRWVWAVNVGTWIMRLGQATTITGPSSFSDGKIRVEPTGGRALVTSNNGVCTLPQQLASPASGSSTVAYRAGLPQPAPPVWSLTTGGIPTATRIRYRFTIRRRLANGTVVESPPSNPIDILTTGANQGVFFSGIATTDPYFAYRTDNWSAGGYAEIIPGDELCVYRSASVTPFSVDPGDELRLRMVVPWNTTYNAFVDPANAPAPFADRLADTQWDGPPLYTNDTQEGAQNANYRPEYARDIALYNDMTFFAGSLSTHRLDLRLNAIGGGTDPQTALRTFTFNGTCAIGSPTVTAIAAADIAALAVGQVIQTTGTSPLAAAAFPAQTKIVSMTATSITMSANATVAGVTGLRSWDWIEIIASAQTQRIYVGPTAGALPSSLASGVTAFRETWGADGGGQGAETQYNNFPSGVGVANTGSRFRQVQLRIAGGYIDPTTLYTTDMLWSFYRNLPSDSSFVVRSTKPLAWDRYVDSTTGVTSMQEGGVAELSWSKISEPEHVPLANRTTVGSASFPIRRILVARQSLLILKDDGLYQCYGSDPSDLRFELVDSTFSMPAATNGYAVSATDGPSKNAGTFGDAVYAMATRGPVAATDTGVTPIGTPILETMRDFMGSNGGTISGAFYSDRDANRIGFSFGISGGVYVYAVDSGAWVRWTLPSRNNNAIAAFAMSPEGSTFYASDYTTNQLVDSRQLLQLWPLGFKLNTWDGFPGSTATVTGTTGSSPVTVTIAAGSEWVPAVGDLFTDDFGALVPVSGVISPTQFTVDTIGLGLLDPVTWYSAYESRVVWVGNADGNIGDEKHFMNVAFPFEKAAVLNRLKLYLAGYRNTSTPTETYIDTNQYVTETLGTFPVAPSYKTAPIVGFTRDWAIKIGFVNKQAMSWFSTAGLSLTLTRTAPGKVAR